MTDQLPLSKRENLYEQLKQGVQEIQNMTKPNEGQIPLEYAKLTEQESDLGQFRQKLTVFLSGEMSDSVTKKAIGTAGFLYKSYSLLNDAYDNLLRLGIATERTAESDRKIGASILVDLLMTDVERTKTQMRTMKSIEDRLSGVEKIEQESSSD